MADRIAKTDLKILIVDDSADAVNLFKDFLRDKR